jgi:outer membrane protein assembly factor BamB
MIDQIRELSARQRNLFVVGEFQKRYDDGKIQVKTHNDRVVEKKEAFPYGFYAKAKGGRAFVFSQGGNLDGFEIFPVQPGDKIEPPELEEGDTALYTGEGSWIILREAGGIEINAKASGNITITGEKGKFYFGNNKKNICELLIGLIDEIKAIVTYGTPPSHTIDPVTQQKLEVYKIQIKNLFMERA